MPEKLRLAIEFELKTGKDFYSSGSFSIALHHFERAHILGQRYIYFHAISHIWMLRVGLAKKNYNEIYVRMIRIPLSVLASAFGIVPEGNSGGTNVGLFSRAPIPQDLRDLLNDDQ
ncbi:MAG: DUF3703 domain-containing protein [Bdellovibrionales bacterium]|nr:DUF3703 domain-containing protein [Bdellovibrionales bacterium]